MHCKSCGSKNLRDLNGEIAMHFSGPKNMDEPIVWVFPKLLVCLNCGTAEFAIPEEQLRLLARRPAADSE